MPDSAVRVVLADDHAIVLHGLESLFHAHADFRVVACCRDGHAALDAVRQGDVDVLIVDLRMPGLNGVEVQRTIVAESLRVRTVVLTAAHTDVELTELVQLGTHGIVLKESSPDVLIDCVRRVSRGERTVPPRLIERVRQRQRTTGGVDGAVLTARERDIVRLVALGRRNKAVAEALSITEGTVKIHLHNVYEKLDVEGRLELLLWAQENGLVTP